MWLTQMHAMTQITVEVALFATKIEKTMWKWGWLLTEIHFLGLEATVVHQQIRVKLQEEGCKIYENITAFIQINTCSVSI